MKRLTCMLLVLVMMMGAMALAESDAPIEIATAEQLAAINDNLSGHYVLTADIHPSGMPACDGPPTGTADGHGRQS